VGVGRASGISDRPNGAELIRAICAGRHAPIALKSCIARPLAGIGRVQVAPVGVALPVDFSKPGIGVMSEGWSALTVLTTP
jgi:hypothetical protein